MTQKTQILTRILTRIMTRIDSELHVSADGVLEPGEAVALRGQKESMKLVKSGGQRQR